MNTGIHDSRPAVQLDPKRFPLIESYRVRCCVTRDTLYATDRLYAEISKMYADLKSAEAEVARLKNQTDEEV